MIKKINRRKGYYSSFQTLVKIMFVLSLYVLFFFLLNNLFKSRPKFDIFIMNSGNRYNVNDHLYNCNSLTSTY